MTYMGAPNWAAKPWFEQLYPGDDVVDWVALDPYADSRVHDFDGLVNKTRQDFDQWPGFYRWMQWRFPGKPVMVAEWGVFERSGDRRSSASFFESVRTQIQHYPQIKALVYFDSPHAPRGDTRFDSDPAAGRAFSELARDPYFHSTPRAAALTASASPDGHEHGGHERSRASAVLLASSSLSAEASRTTRAAPG